MKNCAFLLAGLLLVLSTSHAGNLEPSAAPAPTMKTLDQVQPRIPISSVPIAISSSGSYYLTKDLNATGTAITVNADDVTIDFCGFTLVGPGTTTNNYGVLMSGRSNVEIRNGTVRAFGYGIHESNSSARNHRVFDMRVLYCKASGIQLSGEGHVVRGCTVAYNGIAGSGSTIFGISGGIRSVVTNNTVYANAGSATIISCMLN